MLSDSSNLHKQKLLIKPKPLASKMAAVKKVGQKNGSLTAINLINIGIKLGCLMDFFDYPCMQNNHMSHDLVVLLYIICIIYK